MVFYFDYGLFEILVIPFIICDICDYLFVINE